MKLIIDGYNLIKKVSKLQHISSQDRNYYLKQFGIYAKNKGLKMIVVFDGGESSFNYHEQVWGIEVIYSGFLESADDVIMRLIANHQYQEELMVVTADREIIDFAKQYTLDIIKSEDFYRFVTAGQGLESKKINASTGKTGPANKTSETSSAELDLLMESASRNIQPKKEPEAQLRGFNMQKLSKQEKQVARKLKKL